jgi:hypothetical protein
MTVESVPASRVCPTQNTQRQNKEVIGKEIDKAQAEKDRRAAVERARRKAQSDKIKAITKALSIPRSISEHILTKASNV